MQFIVLPLHHLLHYEQIMWKSFSVQVSRGWYSKLSREFTSEYTIRRRDRRRHIYLTQQAVQQTCLEPGLQWRQRRHRRHKMSGRALGRIRELRSRSSPCQPRSRKCTCRSLPPEVGTVAWLWALPRRKMMFCKPPAMSHVWIPVSLSRKWEGNR